MLHKIGEKKTKLSHDHLKENEQKQGIYFHRTDMSRSQTRTNLSGYFANDDWTDG